MTNRELDLACILADFHRFYQKGGIEFLDRYQTLFGRYYNIDRVKGILTSVVSGDNSEESGVLREARRLSLIETIDTENKSGIKNLSTVFSRVRMDQSENYKHLYYPIKPKNPGAIFPSKTPKGNHDEHIQSFDREMELLSEAPDDYRVFWIQFLNLLERYLWCITAADNEGEDISLFAHAKNTVAIAECLWQAKEDHPDLPFCFVQADFAGIQKYIFSVNNRNEEKVTCRLRARSFLVDELITVLSHVIMHEFQVSIHHILMLTGGKFFLLLPNQNNTEELLIRLRKEFNDELFLRYKGMISVNLAWIYGNAKSLEDYSATVETLSEELSEQKQKSFATVLQSAEGWNEKDFVLYPELSEKKICASCGTELADVNEKYCSHCMMQEKVGGMLPWTKYIVYTDNDPQFPLYKNYGIALYDRLPPDNCYYIEKLSGTSVVKEEVGKPIHYRYIANHIPIDTKKKRVLSFSEIARQSQGDPKLAVFKADVDSLGFLFGMGLRDPSDPSRHYGTISRVDTMSKQFVAFFSGYLETILSTEEEYRLAYCVYSGGDDLFLIGPWNVIYDLAIRINNDFKKLTGDNPNITISAGIELFGEKTHISYMADRTERSLEKAKEYPKDAAERYLYTETGGKNSVVVVGRIFSWEAFSEEWRRIKLFFHEWMTNSKFKNFLGGGKMQRISEYSGMYQEFLKTKDVTKLLFEPLFRYDITRNYGAYPDDELKDYIRTMSDTDEEWTDYIRNLDKNVANYKHRKPELFYADFSMYMLSKLTRKERVDG